MKKEYEEQERVSVAAGTPSGRRILLAKPIVIDRNAKESKRRYSKGLKGVQKLERGTVRGIERLAESFHEGLSNYRSRAKKSSFKKRNGALRDAPKNWTKAAGKSFRVASKAPGDFIKGVDFGALAKTVLFR